MKVVLGHIYSDKKEKFDEIKADLESLGYEVAYENTLNAALIKEVDDEQTDSAT